MIGKANGLQMSPSLTGRDEVNAWLSVQMPDTEVANILVVTNDEIDYFYVIYKVGETA